METVIRFSEINQTKTFEFHFTLSSKKVSKLVECLDLLNMKKVSLQGKLSPLSLNEWSLKAELRATVNQKCVITFKPVQTIVNHEIKSKY